MSSTPEHLELTLSGELEELIRSAAEIRGQSLIEFVVDVVTEASRRVPAGETTTVLSDCDRNRFLELLDQPGEPTAALRQAVETRTARGDGQKQSTVVRTAFP